MAENPVASISPDEARVWLWQHIPFRVTAAIVETIICEEWAATTPRVMMPPGIRSVCWNDAAYQGRISAVRWLIEFIGIQEHSKKPVPSFAANAIAHGKPTTDFGIGMLPGGVFMSTSYADAAFLARTWKGCVQAISHPTRNTNHPPVEVETLTRAMRVVLPFMDGSIYATAGLSLQQVVAAQVQRFTKNAG